MELLRLQGTACYPRRPPRICVTEPFTLQVAGLADALLTAFAIGVGVASGDIVVSTYWQVREHVLDLMAGAVASGIDTLVTRSSEGSRAEPSQPDASRDDRP
jgi:hypothetical protein